MSQNVTKNKLKKARNWFYMSQICHKMSHTADVTHCKCHKMSQNNVKKRRIATKCHKNFSADMSQTQIKKMSQTQNLGYVTTEYPQKAQNYFSQMATMP